MFKYLACNQVDIEVGERAHNRVDMTVEVVVVNNKTEMVDFGRIVAVVVGNS
jgi:hypothetical protein